MDFINLTEPLETDLLVAFGDITGFTALAKRMSRPLDIFSFLQEWARICVGALEAEGGRVVKFIGDSFLAVFDAEDVDRGVRALLNAKRESDAFFAGRGFGSRLTVTAHFGAVVIGPFGAPGREQLDVMGDNVNVAASLGRGDGKAQFLISPQAFRRLSAGTRKLFHKHTPPVTYRTE
jgi:adenylate cyclase